MKIEEDIKGLKYDKSSIDSERDEKEAEKMKKKQRGMKRK